MRRRRMRKRSRAAMNNNSKPAPAEHYRLRDSTDEVDTTPDHLTRGYDDSMKTSRTTTFSTASTPTSAAPPRLRLLTWNVQRKEPIPFLQRAADLDIHVVCAQEVRHSLVGRLQGWSEKCTVNGKSKGCAIYLREPLEQLVIGQGSDEHHSIIWVDLEECHPNHRSQTRIISAYAPQAGASAEVRKRFVTDLSRIVLQSSGSFILGGDMNSVTDPSMDSSQVARTQNAELREAVLLGKLGIDVWRNLHPCSRQWTRLIPGSTQNEGSRLDYWYVSPEVPSLLPRCEILCTETLSDHYPVRLDIMSPIARLGLMCQPRRLHRKISLAGVRTEKISSLLSQLPEDPPARKCPLARLTVAEDMIVRMLRRGLRQLPHWEQKSDTLGKVRTRGWYMERYAAGNLAKVLRPSPAPLQFLRDTSGALITSPRIIQQVCCDNLVGFGGPAGFSVDEGQLQRISATMPRVTDAGIPALTLARLQARLKRSQKDKATGPDSINAYLVSKLPNSWQQLYVDAVNHCITNGIVPHKWNRVEVSLLFKGGDRFDINAYRPLMVGCCLYKFVAEHIRSHVGILAEAYGLLSSEQHGFRSGRNTSRHIWSVASKLHHDPAGLLLLVDLKRAFDSVPHAALLQLLQLLGFHGSTLSIIQAMYHNVECAPVVHGDTHVKYVLKRGIRQGCPISPLLFLLYVEPAARLLALAHPTVPRFLYADDLACWVQKEAQAAAVLSTLKLVTFMGLTVNADKTILLSRATDSYGQVATPIGAIEVAPLSRGKYLGVCCSSIGCGMDTEFLPILTSWFAKVKSLKLPPRVVAYLVNSIILPKITYRAQFGDPLLWARLDQLVWTCFAAATLLPTNASLLSRHSTPADGGLGLRSVQSDCAKKTISDLTTHFALDPMDSNERPYLERTVRLCCLVLRKSEGKVHAPHLCAKAKADKPLSMDHHPAPPAGWRLTSATTYAYCLRRITTPVHIPGEITCYTDGSTKPGGQSGSAAVFRNCAAVMAWEEGTNSFQAELLAILLAVELCPGGAALHVITDCECASKLLGSMLRHGLSAVRLAAGLGILLCIHRRILNKSLTFRVSWTKGHVGTAGNAEADCLANYARLLKCAKTWPFWTPEVAVVQRGILVVGGLTDPLSARTPSTPSLDFVWVKSAPLHYSSWAWQHGYVNVKPFLNYYSKAPANCEWCATTHELTLHGSLAECRGICTWQSLIFDAYPSSWQPTIHTWWASSPPLSERKSLIRFRPPAFLLVVLGLTLEEAHTALRRRVPAIATAVRTILGLARGST